MYYITKESPADHKPAKIKQRQFPFAQLGPGDCLCILPEFASPGAVRMALKRFLKDNAVYKYTVIVDNMLIKVYCSNM